MNSRGQSSIMSSWGFATRWGQSSIRSSGGFPAKCRQSSIRYSGGSAVRCRQSSGRPLHTVSTHSKSVLLFLAVFQTSGDMSGKVLFLASSICNIFGLKCSLTMPQEFKLAHTRPQPYTRFRPSFIKLVLFSPNRCWKSPQVRKVRNMPRGLYEAVPLMKRVCREEQLWKNSAYV